MADSPDTSPDVTGTSGDVSPLTASEHLAHAHAHSVAAAEHAAQAAQHVLSGRPEGDSEPKTDSSDSPEASSADGRPAFAQAGAQNRAMPASWAKTAAAMRPKS
jgi:hypothetical protein